MNKEQVQLSFYNSSMVIMPKGASTPSVTAAILAFVAKMPKGASTVVTITGI